MDLAEYPQTARLGFKAVPYPHLIKYMGSKSKIMDFVVSGINEAYNGGPVCDLFAGSASLSGAIGRQVTIISNDIQSYSAILAGLYLNAWVAPETPTAEELVEKAGKLVAAHRMALPAGLAYKADVSLSEYNVIDARNRDLINMLFPYEWCLFTKVYAGTWWSAEQCLWIDALREVAEEYRDTPAFFIIMTALMYAMAYSSQGTGHYAQYREATSEAAMQDILMYRQRELTTYFLRKYRALLAALPQQAPAFQHQLSTLDYEQRLASLPASTIYADPPYCFVHYSRFYHALETLVQYDHPELQVIDGKVVKGRYRNERHQSPFSIRSQVNGAFEKLFAGVDKTGSNLVLSYSNSGLITLERLLDLATKQLGQNYEIRNRSLDHTHMTMGRKQDRDRSVKEHLILAIRTD